MTCIMVSYLGRRIGIDGNQSFVMLGVSDSVVIGMTRIEIG